MPPNPLTSFEIQKCYQNDPRFNGVYSRDNLPKIKDETYIIFRIQAYDSIICGYFCIRFINFMLETENLTNFTKLFHPNKLKKKRCIVLKYFMTNV